jgi:hypothetical protein
MVNADFERSTPRPHSDDSRRERPKRKEDSAMRTATTYFVSGEDLAGADRDQRSRLYEGRVGGRFKIPLTIFAPCPSVIVD